VEAHTTKKEGSNIDTKIHSVKYDYKGHTSFHNYIERLDLKCASHE